MKTFEITTPHAALLAAAAALAGVMPGFRNAAGAGVVEDHIASLRQEELVALVSRVEDVGHLIDALKVKVAHEVAIRKISPGDGEKPQDNGEEIPLCRAYGHKTPRSFLQALTLAPGAEISARLKLGAAIAPVVSETGEASAARFEIVGKAFEVGEIGKSAASTIVNTLSKVNPDVSEDLVQAAEENLVAAASRGLRLGESGVTCDESKDPAHFPQHADNLREISEGWLEFLNSDGQESTEEQEAKRYFYIGRQKDGLVPVNGLLLPEVATMFGRVIDAITNPRVKQKPSFKPFLIERDGVDEENDPRTHDQLRHDAVAIAIGFAMKNKEMPNLGGEAVSLVIQVTDEEFEKENGTAWVEDAHGETTRIDASAARHASCVGGITRVKYNKNGKIVELGTQERLFNAIQRKAIQNRDGGCLIPGCTVPSTWCEVHHVQEYQDGGETHVDNGVLLCWYHHRHIERNGWSVRMVDGLPEVRAPQWMDPTGTWRKHRVLHRPAIEKPL